MGMEIERLLYEEEGTTLDFKSQQYAFEGATDVEKSEVLKDIVGFANGFSRGVESYVLIGVEEVRGGRSKAVGITKHLEDHSLQQFVNSKVNRPINFSYRVLPIDGVEIGVIAIEDVDTPVYLKKDFGRLKKNEVYVRRGSSIDISKPASPDEIFAMGRLVEVGSAEVLVEFADIETEVAIGKCIPLEFELCNLPSAVDIPDLADPEVECAGGMPRHLDYLLRSARSINGPKTNRDYFRELAEYYRILRLHRPVRILVRNTGELKSGNTRVEIDLDSELFSVMSEGAMPSFPLMETNLMVEPIFRNHFRGTRAEPGDISVTKKTDSFKIVIECLDLQPGRVIVSDTFNIGVLKQGMARLAPVVYSDSFKRPLVLGLEIEAKVQERSISIEELTG